MKFPELLKLIPKGLKNPENILSGWINDIRLQHGELSHDKVEKIISRRTICTSCPFNSVNAATSKEYKDLTGVNYETSFQTLHCAMCSCPIHKKTACLHCQCGLEEWNLKNPNKKQKLKWDATDEK